MKTSPSARILVIEGDPLAQRILDAAFRQSGAEAVMMGSMAEALRNVAEREWSAVVVDLHLADGSGFEVIRQLHAARPRVPVVVVSHSGDFDVKIEALRLGASTYYQKPVDWRALVAHVLGLLGSHAEERILIVEDDSVTAVIVQHALDSAGYQTAVCSDSRRFEAMLLELRPDLVLMDIGLPHIDGVELTQFLRQDARFETIPVIYMTAQGGEGTTLRTAGSGGGATLVKPFKPDVLLAAVGKSLEHYRRLRALLERDPLTGVLTRQALLDRAAAALAVADRDRRREYCLAMLDLDRFKEINDRYGHPAGDRVLAALGGLLSRSLRMGDAVGRYGGEEFALVLNDVDERRAVAMLERVLTRFRLIEHRLASQATVTVTFSAGVASSAFHGATVDEWIDRAGRTLDQAKSAGRDRVRRFEARFPSGHAAPTVDQETLAGLRELSALSGHDVVREVVELFLAIAPERIENIEEAVRTRSSETLRTAAHAFRGASGNVGLLALMDACETLERIGAGELWDESAAAADRLRDAFHAAREALMDVLAGHS